ncbi:hypothetical protein [Phormidesmis priestleyi]|nr:hypothetical protein [Phormidesmis priestleyi]
MQREFGKLPSIPQFPFWNNLPTPVKTIVRPMLLASVGLHALLLFVPLPGENQPSKPTPEKTVKVTQLPPTSQSKSKAQPLAKATIAPSPKRVMPAARPNAITIPSLIKPKPVESAPETAAASKSAPAANNPFADFPRYANAKPGSFESLPAALSPLSFQTGDPLTTVEAFFRSELPKKQFEIGSPTNLGDVKAISVTKGGVTKYLHLMTRAGKGTVFFLLDNAIDINSLPKDTKIQTEPPEKLELTQLFTELADQVNFVTNNPEQELNDPIFVSASGIEFDQGKATAIGAGTTVPLAQLDAQLQSQLANIGFTVTASGSYGGGTVYQITKNSYSRYLTIAPTKDGGGWVYVFEKAPG